MDWYPKITSTNIINKLKERIWQARDPSEEWINWTRWSCSKSESAEDTLIQDITIHHIGMKTEQERNKLWVVSNPTHPVSQNWDS